MPMPSSVGLTYGQIWQNFRQHHSGLSESELRRIHNKWVQISAEVGWRTDEPHRQDAGSPRES